jgi:hypothetical protein
MESEGKAGSYPSKYRTMLNNWVRFNDIQFKIEEKGENNICIEVEN